MRLEDVAARLEAKFDEVLHALRTVQDGHLDLAQNVGLLLARTASHETVLREVRTLVSTHREKLDSVPEFVDERTDARIDARELQAWRSRKAWIAKVAAGVVSAIVVLVLTYTAGRMWRP
jgi:hypothetical protein